MRIRTAKSEDLVAIVKLLANDSLGTKREAYSLPLTDSYLRAFEQIDKDPNNHIVVGCEESKGTVIATLQLTFIPHLTFQGGMRAQIEGVRVHEDYRNLGLGKQLFEWAIEKSKEKGCHLVQLTTNKKRNRAHDFYEALGFEATHEGMKLYLKPW